MPGRWADARQPNEKELAATLVVAFPIDEVSAKVRTGPPLDDAEDMALPHWAGVLPCETVWKARRTWRPASSHRLMFKATGARYDEGLRREETVPS